MSTLENRIAALNAAVALGAQRPDVDWTRNANHALNFLETGSFTPAPPVAADPTPVAAKKPRAAKPAVETALVAVATPAEPAILPKTDVPVAAGSAPNKEPTLDDVRTALVACQTRKGGKDAPQAILSKYSANKTTGGLSKDKYATVIAECAAA